MENVEITLWMIPRVKPTLVLHRGKVRLEVGLLIAQAELLSDAVPVAFNGSRGDVEQLGYLLGRLAVPDHIGDLDLRGGEPKVCTPLLLQEG
jgi:hypothetical protein